MSLLYQTELYLNLIFNLLARLQNWCLDVGPFPMGYGLIQNPFPEPLTVEQIGKVITTYLRKPSLFVSQPG